MKRRTARFIRAALILLAASQLQGCVSSSEFSYYSSGDNFTTPGGYNRSIFSSSNF